VLSADPDAALTALAGAIPAPVRVLPLDEFAETLGARPGETWLVRPDGYVAAVVPGAGPTLVDALRRATGGSA